MPAGIILPEALAPVASSSKGKGKAAVKSTATGNDEEAEADATSTSIAALSVSATQGGDRADAVARTQAGERLLKAVRDTWDDHCACMSKLRDVLKYVVSA